MAISRGRAWLVAVVATLAMSVSYIDRQVVAALGVSVRRGLGVDAASFGLLAGSFSLAYMVVAPLAGRVVDRAGARRGLGAAIVTWSAVSAAHSLAPSFAVLFGLRVLLGAAEAPSFPAAAQAVRRALPASDRSAAFGLLFTGSSIGAAIAAPLALALDRAWGWRVAFAVTSGLGLLWLPLWVLVTRAPEVRAMLRPAPTPAVLVTAPVRTLLPGPAVLRAMLLVFGSAPGLMMMYVWLPQYLELGRHVPHGELSRYLWLPPLMADAGMVGFGILASRLDRRARGIRSHVGLVLTAACLEATLALTPLVPGTWTALLLVGAAAAGGGGLYTLLTADMMARVDPARASVAGGWTAAAQSLVYVVLNPLVGRWIDATGGSFDGPLFLLGLTALPLALAWVAGSPDRAVRSNGA